MLLPTAFLAFLLLFVLYPSVMVLMRSFYHKGSLGLGNMVAFFAKPHMVRILWQSGAVAALVAVASTLMGLCLALVSFKTSMAFKGLFRTAAVVPLIIPGFVASLSYIFLFGRNGLITYKLLGLNLSIYGWHSVVLVQIMNLTTTAFLIMSAAILSIDDQAEDAARTLGASEWEVFSTVTLPLLRPGVLASMVLVFMKSMADFSTPLFLGGRFTNLAAASYSQLIGSYNLEMAATMNVLLLSVCLMAFWVFNRAKGAGEGFRRSIGGRRKDIQFPPAMAATMWSLSMAFSALVYMLLLSVFLAAFTKHLGANFGLTLAHFQEGFQRGFRGMVNTFIFASATAAVTAIAGMAGAWLITRSCTARRLLDLLSTAPVAVPGTFFGVAYILAFNRLPLLLAGTWTLVLILLVVRELPLGIRSGVSVLEQQDRSVEDAASTLGDSSVGIFFRVTLPSVRPAMVITALHSFVASVQAVGALIFIVSPGTKLLSIDVFEAVYKGQIGPAAAMSVVMISLSLVGIAGITAISSKSKGGGQSWGESLFRRAA